MATKRKNTNIVKPKIVESEVVETKKVKDNNIKKDWGMSILFGIGFFVVLFLSNVIDQKFNFSAIFNLVDFYVMLTKAFVASAIAWTVKKLVFSNTLGKDFGEIFNSGWSGMSHVEKARWTIIVFLVIFVSVMFNFA